MKAAGSRGSSQGDASALDDADQETSELCPGFKDVDAFVKVSREREPPCVLNKPLMVLGANVDH